MVDVGDALNFGAPSFGARHARRPRAVEDAILGEGESAYSDRWTRHLHPLDSFWPAHSILKMKTLVHSVM
ncbi:MAG: hypothetical protein CME06_13730 [Gemmatimonadetes bacterium]|nr:hypothetical protein [Gemmatimonadota bacterium]